MAELSDQVYFGCYIRIPAVAVGERGGHAFGKPATHGNSSSHDIFKETATGKCAHSPLNRIIPRKIADDMLGQAFHDRAAAP